MVLERAITKRSLPKQAREGQAACRRYAQPALLREWCRSPAAQRSTLPKSAPRAAICCETSPPQREAQPRQRARQYGTSARPPR